MKQNSKSNHKGGRIPKDDPARNRYVVYLNDEENVRFLALFEQSNMRIKGHFIASCIFGKPIRVVKIDKAAMDYYMRLTTFHSQFRAIGVNYNQITKALKTTFSEKKALAFLYKLEKATIELVEINKLIIELTKEFEQQWLQK